MKENSTSSVLGRKLRLALAFVVVLAVMAPIAVIAAGGTFVDDDTSIFEGDIEWMAANGITSGCGPDTYCPEDNVTRGQMAAFMKRLATKKVVDAATAVTADSATTAISADTAAQADNADTLAGRAPTFYDNPAWGTACSGTNCPNGAGLTLIKVLELPVSAPQGGYLTVGSSFQGGQPGTNDVLQTWVVMDEAVDCGSWFFFPLASIPGSYSAILLDGGVTFATNASTVVTPVTAGNHTLQLCVLGADTVTSTQGSLTATFSGSGSVNVIAGTPSPAHVEFLKDSMGDVDAIN